jgi:penicillin amidase
MRLDGLESEVLVSRDRWGIPHIAATTDADAWFGLGFCHGQDRAFQLEILARAGRGTLSAILGRGALEVDRLSRTLGFHRLAEAQLHVLDGDVRAVLDAYVRGVNASTSAGPRPHELVLLRASRSPWTPADVLAFLGLQSLALAGNWDTELARLQILLADGPQALAAVDRTYAPWLPVTIPVGAEAGPALDRLGLDLARLRDLVGGSGASNAWAIAGARTASGAPILANDPHLAPAVPAPWYLAHLRTPDWSIAGASFVGGPAFPTGHNGRAAWGITAACTDSADLFWEELDLAAGTARGPHGPEPIERTTETIEVRGAASVREEIVLTRRGPIITPLLDDRGLALSLRATWLEPRPVRGFLDVHRARDFETFRAGFGAWPGPALNVVYADAAGHIGWQLTGALPRRRAGNGTLPLPAWDPEAAWHEDLLPFDALPRAIDPQAGFVASANNAARADVEDAPFLGTDWLDGYRQARIVEVLSGRDDWDVASSARLQTDLASRPWAELRDMFAAVRPADGDARLGLALLEGWDGVVGAASPAASVYQLAVADLAASLAREQAPRGWRWAMGAGVGPAMPRTTLGAVTVSRLVATLRDGLDRSASIEAAVGTAVRALRNRHGPDPARWAWGRVRPLRLVHVLANQRPLDRLLNVGPVPLGGDTNTVAQAGVQPLDPTANPAAIANHRTVIDLGDLEASRFVLAGGQSGNPMSRHYDDLFALWRRGEAVPIPWSDAAVESATIDRLVLRPLTRA